VASLLVKNLVEVAGKVSGGGNPGSLRMHGGRGASSPRALRNDHHRELAFSNA